MQNNLKNLSIQHWLVIFIGLGVAYRLTRWLVQMPIWGDEAMLAVNFIDRSPDEIFSPLDNGQVAPPFFILISWLTIHFIGANEWIIRAFACVAGITAFLSTDYNII